MQPINFLMSYNSICDNFTGLVEFIRAAALGYFCWRHQESQRSTESSDITYDISIQALTTFSLIVWSLRLGLFLLYRMRVRPAVDTRLGEPYQRNTQSMYRLFRFWIIHGTWGFVCSLPVTLLNTKNIYDTQKHSSIDLMQYVALILWFLGFVIESVADYVKLKNYGHVSSISSYKKLKQPTYYNMNNHILWKYSRHPNFLGECICWLGLGLAAALEFYPETSLNPLYSIQTEVNYNISFFLSFLSPIFTFGIMLGEAILLTEWKNNLRFRKENDITRHEYDEYKKKTSLLIPCPPQLYVLLPKNIRKYIFFEWDIYEKAKDPNWLITSRNKKL